MSSQNRIGLLLAVAVLISAGVMVFSRDTRASDDVGPGNVSVACGPSQQAVIQRIEGASHVNVACVDSGVQAMTGVAAAPASAPLQPVPVAYYGTPPTAPLQPVVYTAAPMTATPVATMATAPAPIASAPVAAAPAPAAPVVASAPATSAAAPAAPARRAAEKPSTQKRLVIIGGSAGAGAGIGAAIGGKKGALIGAAIGAGGATVVDQVRNR